LDLFFCTAGGGADDIVARGRVTKRAVK